MVAERLERLLNSLVLALRDDSKGTGMEVGQIINNMRNEIKVLSSAEEAAFHLWLSHQYAKKNTKVHWEELPNM